MKKPRKITGHGDSPAVVFPSEAIAAELSARIKTGHWPAGTRIPGEIELARQYGVCRATMNRILKELETAGLVYGGRGRGRFAADFAARRTGIVEVVLSDTSFLTQPAGARVLEAMRQRLGQAGYHLRVTALNFPWGGFPYGHAREYVDLIDPQHIDGCIVLTQALPVETALAVSVWRPVVWFHQPTMGPGLCGICYDWLSGAYDATQHLLDLGHRSIGLVTIHPRYAAGREQAGACRLAMRERLPAGEGSFHPAHAEHFHDHAETRQLTRQLLAATPRPTAILCGSDDFAPDVFQVLAEAGLKVPGDISVVSWNDTLRPDETPVPVTSLRMDFTAAGTRAAEILLALLENPRGELPTVEIAATLVVRASTAPPPGQASAAV